MDIIQQHTNPEGYIYADVGITSEEWCQLLESGVIASYQIEMLLVYFREQDHWAVPNQLAKKFGGSPNKYMNPIWRLGESVQKHLARFSVVRTDGEGNSTDEKAFWCIPMIGKNTRQGFAWKVKDELCKALEVYLYQHLINIYKERRASIDLVQDDELFKWEIANRNMHKAGADFVASVIAEPHNNLMGWRQKDHLNKLCQKNPSELKEILQNLFDDTVDLQERLTAFIKSVRDLGEDIDERAASVLLACHAPAEYYLFKDSYYRPLCQYLGVKAVGAGEKYLHFKHLMQPLLDIVKTDTELHQLLAKNIKDLPQSDLLIAQDVVYTLFERGLVYPKKQAGKFDWIPFYQELATKLLEYKDKRGELAKAIYGTFDREKDIKFLHDASDEQGNPVDFDELDPFTVFSIINRNMNSRKDLMQRMKELFDISAAVPTSFDGIPTQHSMSAAFICFTRNRLPDGKDMDRLWTLFELTMTDNKEGMEDVFNATLKQVSIAIPKLTMGLFYIQPYKFLALDNSNRAYLEKYGIPIKSYHKMTYADYEGLLNKVSTMMSDNTIAESNFVEFSANAYSQANAMADPESGYYMELANLLRYRKNMIIQGAPDVGKTFDLYKIITRLCFPELTNASQEVLKQKFRQLKDNHQVEYVTFHQSMDYEEFVEGIRPKTTDDGEVTYETEDGIFKRVCKAAREPIVEENPLQIKGDAAIWKVSLAGTGDNPVRKDCMKNGYIRIGWDEWGADLSKAPGNRYEGRVVLSAFYDKMQIGDIVFSCYSSRTIDAIGVITGDAEWREDLSEYKRVRKVEWLVKGINEDIYEMNDNTQMVLATVYRLNYITLDNVFRLLDKYGVHNPTQTKANTNPYVLVIDEFNRGNVSKIFGELITIIEQDKRAGRDSETDVLLPYSGDRFSVPDNLYIIGTMNTADRSLDTLDYAMRRRFAFVRFKPKSLSVPGFDGELFKVVSELFIDNFDEYNSNGKAFVKRSSILADDINPEDVWIGHSYFIMQDEEENDRTKFRIEYEIVPILEEYIKDGVFKDVDRVHEVIEKLMEYANGQADD